MLKQLLQHTELLQCNGEEELEGDFRLKAAFQGRF